MSPLTRRNMLLASAVAASVPALSACTQKQESPGDQESSASTAPQPGGQPKKGAPGAQRTKLAFTLEGRQWDLEVGPAAVRDGYTLLQMSFSHSFPDEESLGTLFLQGTGTGGSYDGVRVMSLASSVLYPSIGNLVGDGYSRAYRSVKAGEALKLYTMHGALPPEIEAVEVFVPVAGVATGVPVVGADQADFSFDQIMDELKADTSLETTCRLLTMSLAADGASDTEEDEGRTTVTISGDVTFESGSAQLSAQADTVLASVVSQLSLYPSGGTMQVTGHTDDILDDASNQTLSEQRAQAVADRLGGLTDLSAWSATVSGKGESEPRVPNDSDDNRQTNRRVEVLLTPAKPEEAQTAEPSEPPSAAADNMPEPKGPVGTGPDGVDVQMAGHNVHVSMQEVRRHEGFLLGEVLLTSDADFDIDYEAFTLPRSFKGTEWASEIGAVTNLTLLKAGTYYPVVGYLKAGKYSKPLSNHHPLRLSASGLPLRLVGVWPDTREEAVVLDLPWAETDSLGDAPVCLRLTDIPVR